MADTESSEQFEAYVPEESLVNPAAFKEGIKLIRQVEPPYRGGAYLGLLEQTELANGENLLNELLGQLTNPQDEDPSPLRTIADEEFKDAHTEIPDPDKHARRHGLQEPHRHVRIKFDETGDVVDASIIELIQAEDHSETSKRMKLVPWGPSNPVTRGLSTTRTTPQHRHDTAREPVKSGK